MVFEYYFRKHKPNMRNFDTSETRVTTAITLTVGRWSTLMGSFS